MKILKIIALFAAVEISAVCIWGSLVTWGRRPAAWVYRHLPHWLKKRLIKRDLKKRKNRKRWA